MVHFTGFSRHYSKVMEVVVLHWGLGFHPILRGDIFNSVIEIMRFHPLHCLGEHGRIRVKFIDGVVEICEQVSAKDPSNFAKLREHIPPNVIGCDG